MELFIDTARVARIVDDVKLLTFPKMSSGELNPIEYGATDSRW